MNLQQIKREILKGGFSNSELSELINYISSTKTQQAKADIFVGADVWVVQKTKRTPGVVEKINIFFCPPTSDNKVRSWMFLSILNKIVSSF